MKRIILFCMAIVLLTGCGSGVNQEECSTFCSKMSNLGATGGWECLTVDIPDFNTPVLEGTTTVSYADYDSYIQNMKTRGDVFSTYEDIQNWMDKYRYCDARIIVEDETTNQPICKVYEAGSADADDENGFTIWRTMKNPANYGECLSNCLVDTNGDAMPEVVKDGVLMAADKYDFLSVQFSRQCYIEAVEL